MLEKSTSSLSDLVKCFLKLRTIGFGDPVAHVGYMHQDLVEDKMDCNQLG